MVRKGKTPVAEKINEDFSYVSAKDNKTYTLPLKEKRFAEFYLINVGNGRQSVIDAGYDVYNEDGTPNGNLAGVMAHEIIRKPNVKAYLAHLLTQSGFDDETIEREHAFLIQQNSDMPTKARAIDMYYKLRGKIKDPSLIAVDPDTLEAINKALTPFLPHGTQGNPSK